MNKVVRERYPVANLPEDLRKALPQVANVTVVLEYDPEDTSATKRPFSFDELYAMARPSFNSLEEVADHIRKIRAEWD